MSRDKSLDIAKGIGIILVVCGHSAMPHSSIIFRFHMAMFFIISGWCFSDKYIQNFKSVLHLIYKKIKGLYLPFILFNGATLLLSGLFIHLNMYTDNPLFLEETPYGGNAYGITDAVSFDRQLFNRFVNILRFGGETQFGGAAWFLRVLFGVSVLFCIINWILKSVTGFSEKMRMLINIIFSIFLLYVSWQWMQDGQHFKLQFETVAASYIAFCAGYYLRNVLPKTDWKQSIVIIFLFLSILLYCDNICLRNAWDSNVNNFSNPIMYMVSSMAGFLVVLYSARIMSKTGFFHIVEVIGQHTLCILLFHFMSFKIVTLIQISIYHEPPYRLASFPIYHSGNGWWILYTLSGTIVPLLIALCYTNIKVRLRRYFYDCKQEKI